MLLGCDFWTRLFLRRQWCRDSSYCQPGVLVLPPDTKSFEGRWREYFEAHILLTDSNNLVWRAKPAWPNVQAVASSEWKQTVTTEIVWRHFVASLCLEFLFSVCLTHLLICLPPPRMKTPLLLQQALICLLELKIAKLFLNASQMPNT